MNGSSPPRFIGSIGELPAADAEQFRLICGYCDGVADRADLLRFEKLLETPAGMALYLAVADLDATVRWRLRWRNRRPPDRPTGPRPDDRPVTATARPAAVPPPSRRDGGRWLETLRRPAPLAILLQSLLILAALVLAVVGQWHTFPDPAGTFDPAAFGDAAARISGLHDVAWAAGGKARQVSDLLPEGARLDVARGLVEIVHADGATVVMEGPAAVVVKGRTAAQLEHGRLTARVTPARGSHSGRFAVHAPKAVVTDLGTEFGVEVGGDGELAVHVFEGLVDVATASNAVLRIAAGQSAAVDAGGRATQLERPPSRFVRSFPQSSRVPTIPARRPTGFFWDESVARVLYQDSFAGAGQLKGTSPASRGGVGAAAWSAPPAGWECGAALVADAAGAALLPLAVESGCIYRASVEMHVTSGGIGWAAVGFADDSSGIVGVLSHAWLMQRHETAKLANECFAGPRQAGSVGRGDRHTGPHVREVVLDTSRPQWQAFFLVDGAVVASHRYDGAPPPITKVGLGLFANTKATLRNFRVSVIRQDTMSRQP